METKKTVPLKHHISVSTEIYLELIALKPIIAKLGTRPTLGNCLRLVIDKFKETYDII